MKEKSRCSTVFHVLVPGGEWHTDRERPISTANFCFRAMRAVKALKTGIVRVDHVQASHVEAPQDGFEESGIGREPGPWGVEECLEVKQVYINLSEERIRGYDGDERR
jgi:hypothetical protein